MSMWDDAKPMIGYISSPEQLLILYPDAEFKLRMGLVDLP